MVREMVVIANIYEENLVRNVIIKSKRGVRGKPVNIVKKLVRTIKKFLRKNLRLRKMF
jgi:hypothetical protein